MEHVKKYIEENKDRFLDELFGLIRIPSISSESARKDDMLAAAEYWKESMLKAGADKAEIMPTDGNPVVYGGPAARWARKGTRPAGPRGARLRCPSRAAVCAP